MSGTSNASSKSGRPSLSANTKKFSKFFYCQHLFWLSVRCHKGATSFVFLLVYRNSLCQAKPIECSNQSRGTCSKKTTCFLLVILVYSRPLWSHLAWSAVNGRKGFLWIYWVGSVLPHSWSFHKFFWFARFDPILYWSSSGKVHRLAENPIHRAQDQLLFLWIIIKAIENKETTDHLNCSCYTR